MLWAVFNVKATENSINTKQKVSVIKRMKCFSKNNRIGAIKCRAIFGGIWTVSSRMNSNKRNQIVHFIENIYMQYIVEKTSIDDTICI